jgi:hypothetical protein
MTTATLTRLPAVTPAHHPIGTALYVTPRLGFPRRHETQTGTVQRVTPHWAAGEHMACYWLLFDGDEQPWPYAESEVEAI